MIIDSMRPAAGGYSQRRPEKVDCPACGGDMSDTGRRDTCEITRRPLRVMKCQDCGNESGVG